jgi:hypothetical protein
MEGSPVRGKDNKAAEAARASAALAFGRTG